MLAWRIVCSTAKAISKNKQVTNYISGGGESSSG
jgi:hypothetical protein